MSTAYEFENTNKASDLFELKEDGYIYTRLNNPTTDIFEKRFAILENGISALATASGMSAIFYSIVNSAEAGDNIIHASKLYGGSITLFSQTLKRFGIESRNFDIDQPTQIENLIDDKTKVIFFESITNPSVDVPNFDAIVKIANKHGILTVVDNTVATPCLCNPIDFGIDIIVHSTSKYTTGQGLAIGGIIVEAPHTIEKLKNNPRYEHFNIPDESYHGLIYTKKTNTPFNLRARLSLLRDLGAVGSPFNSWLYIQGLETLHLRMKQHSKSALEIARFLNNHPNVKKVNYPLLENDKNYTNATKYLKNGASGLLSFEVETKAQASKIANELQLFSLVVNIGDSKSIVTHPASTTHQQLSNEELQKAGVPQGLIRLSIGLEDTNDLIDDLKKVL